MRPENLRIGLSLAVRVGSRSMGEAPVHGSPRQGRGTESGAQRRGRSSAGAAVAALALLLTLAAVAALGAERLGRVPLHAAGAATRPTTDRPLPRRRPGAQRPRRQRVQVRGHARPAQHARSTRTRSSSAASAAPTSSTTTPHAPTTALRDARTGRPDVTIAVLDSGIKWNDAGAMDDLRLKVRLNPGELPSAAQRRPRDPARGGRGLLGRRPYATPATRPERRRRLQRARLRLRHPRRSRDTPTAASARPACLVPQDLLIAFTDGADADGNGYVDDIAGWDFLDNDNDPFDDVQYGHGTGEARDSSSEADNGGAARHLPELHGRCRCASATASSPTSTTSRQAVIYATDNDVQVVQEALGTLNNSSLAREAVDYAYRHGVTVIASAADEAAQHNNWPSIAAARDPRQLGHRQRPGRRRRTSPTSPSTAAPTSTPRSRSRSRRRAAPRTRPASPPAWPASSTAPPATPTRRAPSTPYPDTACSCRAIGQRRPTA